MTDGRLDSVIAALVPDRAEMAEVYRKEGRSRLLAWTGAGYTVGFRHEEGWAVRAGGSGESLFQAGTGTPEPGGPWGRARPGSLRLPDPAPVPTWSAPPGLEAPLVSENEGVAWLERLRAELAAEAPEARLQWAVLEDGSSRSELVSSRGVRASWRHRSAFLRVQLAVPTAEPTRIALDLAEREARAFHPRRIARRVGDRIQVRRRGRTPERDRGEFLIAPEVGIRLLRGLLPLFVGERAEERRAALRDRRDRIGSTQLTLIDDARLPEGLLAAAVDGEGLATRRVALVEQGVAVGSLLPWWRAGRRAGSSRRDSWREPPRLGPSHLYLEPSRAVSVADLLAAVPRGYYLIDAGGEGRFELEADRFALPVSGFALEGGRVQGAVAGAWLCGSVRALLRGIQAVGRDLTFLPVGGMIGAPSFVAVGLELRSTP